MLTRSQDASLLLQQSAQSTSPFSSTTSSSHLLAQFSFPFTPPLCFIHSSCHRQFTDCISKTIRLIRAENLLTHTRLLIGLVTTVIFPIATPRLGDALAVATLELVGAASPLVSCKVKKKEISKKLYNEQKVAMKKFPWDGSIKREIEREEEVYANAFAWFYAIRCSSCMRRKWPSYK